MIVKEQISPLRMVCRGESLARVPVWLMRQAGRYLPAYAEFKKRYHFSELMNNPELAAKISLLPWQQLGVDGVIIFADIMTPLADMGPEIEFNPGPSIREPLRVRSAIEALGTLEHLAEDSAVGRVISTIQLVQAELTRSAKNGLPLVPLIGFAGAPLTLAAYLVEGGSSSSFQALRILRYTEPEAFSLLLDKLAIAMGTYLRAQAVAGVEIVQLFDTYAHLWSVEDYETLIVPKINKVFSYLADLPVTTLYFGRQLTPFLPSLTKIQATGFSLDWTVNLREARQILGPKVILQGNLDPAVLFSRKEIIKREVERILLSAVGPFPYIFNLGHGVLPETPVEHVQYLVELVQNFSR